MSPPRGFVPTACWPMDRRVGMMGLSALGLPVARRLRDAGFNVAGWARTPRTEPGMECFYGPDQLAAFLARTDILVNTLAVTPVTTNIINAANLARLPKGATIINLARGKHVVDDNLIAAIDSGHINSATLDLFRVEPLPGDHPFWKHPRAHTARRPHPEALTTGILENIRCCWRQTGSGDIDENTFHLVVRKKSLSPTSANLGKSLGRPSYPLPLVLARAHIFLWLCGFDCGRFSEMILRKS